MPDPFRIRCRRPEDSAGIRALMARVYPPPLHGPEAVWSERSLLHHQTHFPEGQFVAEAASGELIGTSTSMRTLRVRALEPHTWLEMTGQGTLSTHDPDGDTLYGVNIAVDPAWQGKHVGHALYDARLALARRLGCRAFVAGARLAGYHRHADHLSPERYLEEVVAGRIFDPTVSKQLRLGFRVRGLLRDYAPDPETHGHAALIVMDL